jgi:hypothetical protein
MILTFRKLNSKSLGLITSIRILHSNINLNYKIDLSKHFYLFNFRLKNRVSSCKLKPTNSRLNWNPNLS